MQDYDKDLEGDLNTIISIGFVMTVSRLSIMELYRHALWMDTDAVFQKHNEEEEEVEQREEMGALKARWMHICVCARCVNRCFHHQN